MARVFPALGFSPLRPTRFTPVYFPAWFLDVELQGEAVIRGDDRQASAQIHNAYIPGSDYKVISSAPIAPPDPHTQETLPFSQDVLRQHDLDVVCIPYNISPFSIVDIARQLSYPEATIAPDFRFTASSLKSSLFAAYPVLIPLYLAQYEYDTDSGKQFHTMFVEAHGPSGNVWAEPFTNNHATEREIFNRARSFFGMPEDSNPIVSNLGYPKKFLEIVGFSLTPHQDLGNALRDYLEDALNLPSTPATLAAASVSELGTLSEDSRVREFTPEERKPIIEWLKLGAELMMVERMHEAMSKARDGGHVVVTGSGAKENSKMTIIDGAIQHLVEKSNALLADRRKTKPEWAKTEEDLEEEKSEEPEKPPSTESKPENDSP